MLAHGFLMLTDEHVFIQDVLIRKECYENEIIRKIVYFDIFKLLPRRNTVASEVIKNYDFIKLDIHEMFIVYVPLYGKSRVLLKILKTKLPSEDPSFSVLIKDYLL